MLQRTMDSSLRCTVNPEEMPDGSECGRPGAWMRLLYVDRFCEKSVYCQSCYERYGPSKHARFLSHMKWEFKKLC